MLVLYVRQTTDARADRNTDPVDVQTIRVLEPCITYCLHTGCHAEMYEEIHLARLLRGEVGRCIETPDRRTEARGELRDVETLDGTHTGNTGDDVPPGDVDIIADRRDQAEPGDRYASTCHCCSPGYVTRCAR